MAGQPPLTQSGVDTALCPNGTWRKTALPAITALKSYDLLRLNADRLFAK
jgi:hypothetical protein